MAKNTERDALIVELARSGRPFKEIAAQVGISTSHVCTIAKRAGLSRRIVGVSICTVDDCQRPYASNGMCSMHYQRLKKTGSLELAPRPDFDPNSYRKAWRAENPGKVRQYTKKYRANNPEKRRAHRKVEVAVRDGRITKEPCTVCGNTKSQGHHDDYSKPLEVIWLCAKHHKERHRLLKQENRDPDK